MFDKFFESLSKFMDVLNVGRLVFYLSAGFLAFYPFLMIIKLLALEDKKLKSFMALEHVYKYDPWLVFFGSLVLGFLIASAGYATVIKKLSPPLDRELEDDFPTDHTYSVAYRYPWLKNKADEDYQDWLIAEYFRFVELAIFVPLGFLLGLPLLFVYSVIYLLRCAAAYPFEGYGGEYAFLLILAILLGVLWFHVWPQLWKPKVVVPILKTYLRTKKFLVIGVEQYQEQIKVREKNGNGQS